MAEAGKPQPEPPLPVPASKVRESWLFRASRLEFASIAAALALLIFTLGEWLDWLVLDKVLPFRTMVIADAVVAALAGLLLFKVLADARRRHREMLRHMETIAEMNHHIRNALQVIAYHTVSHPSSGQAVDQVGEAVERIEWALREVLPERRLAEPGAAPHQPERRRAH
jgi:ABC-type bacteriocin/lantibiotic exporter with double-glycine peptidase domain